MFKKTVTMLLLSCSLMGVLLGHAFAAEPITEKYEFPAQPGTQEWLDLETTQARYESCQIPKEILTNMTTEALVETAGEYPFLANLYAYNSLQEGFETLLEESELFAELLNRVDAADVLLEKYREIEIVQETGVATFETFAVPRLLEIYLCQPEIQDRLSDTDIELLNQEFFENYEKRVAAPEVYGNDVSAAYRLQAEQETSHGMRASTKTIRTPNGTKVSVWVRGEEMNSDEKDELDERFRKQCPGATYVSSSTTTYNCHSYAWLRDNDEYDYRKYWMDHPEAFWEDGSYSAISGSEQVDDIGVYTNTKNVVKHSAIVYSTSGSKTLYISKWAEGPLMIHSEIDSPYGNFSIKEHYR